TQVENNIITLAEHPTNTNPNLETYGICLEAGFGINETGLGNTVTDNTITGAGMNANSNGTGILLMQQGNTNIGCNTVEHNRHGFRFFGNNPNTKFWDNVMLPNNQYGFTLHNGIIGIQGNLPSITGGTETCTSNNSWVYDTWDAGNDQYMTNCINSLPSQSPLVVLQNIPGLNPDGSGTTDDQFYINLYQHTGNYNDETIWYAPTNDVECERCTGATLYFRNPEDFTILEQIADGTIMLLNDRPEERLLVMQEQLFELLHAQPDLLANSNSLQQFIYNNQWTSLDFIYYAGQLLAENNMEMLQIVMDYWTPENNNLSEAYYVYFEWLINMYGDPNYQPDLNEVWELANQCPLTHGTIVYAVRNLYNTLTERVHSFENNCEPPQERSTTNKPKFIRLKEPKKKTEIQAQEKEKSKLVLYPNPATNIINIAFAVDIKQIVIFDVIGRKQLSKQLNGTKNVQLNISGIGKGMFFVQVTGKDGSIQTQRLIVQ
ncbi:MAG: T9SS type A sorting domain-containing protein, partial [Chitinophagaceae bacterium]|nr:T9SS type A sorting domain-containing protein [Chitinophagaceae bacterium]